MSGASKIQTQVYPRVCGGTLSFIPDVPNFMGLSPRVRGNRLADYHAERNKGSIPACAGEPVVFHVVSQPTRVYPRVCGGTSFPVLVRPPPDGLSPRVRGNLDRGLHYARRVRSIPACAGEPRERRRDSSTRRVYPRVCGGTSDPSVTVAAAIGLSPRVRGNRIISTSRPGQIGSIPACAGEP